MREARRRADRPWPGSPGYWPGAPAGGHRVTPLAGLPVLLLDAQATAADPARGALARDRLGAVVGGRGPRAARRRGDRPRRGAAARGRRCRPPWPGSPGCGTAEWARGIAPALVWERLRRAAERVAPPPVPAVVHFARFEEPFLRALHERHGTGPVPLRPRLHPRHRLPPAPGAAPPHAARAGRLLRGGGAAPAAQRRPRGRHRVRVAPPGRAAGRAGGRRRPRRAARVAGAAGPPRPRAAFRSPRERRLELPGPPGRLPAAARGRRRALRRQGHLPAPARERPLPRARRASARSRCSRRPATCPAPRPRPRSRRPCWRRTRSSGSPRPSTSRWPRPGGRSGSRRRTCGACGRGRTRSTPWARSSRRRPSRRSRRCAPSSRLDAAGLARRCAPGRSGSSPPTRPGPTCFAAGLARFVREHGPVAGARDLLRLGARLWARRRAAARAPGRTARTEPKAETPRRPAWDAERVTRGAGGDGRPRRPRGAARALARPAQRVLARVDGAGGGAAPAAA